MVSALTLLPEEFFKEGYAQEVNCILLHPLGLSLRLVYEGTVCRICVMDYRDSGCGVLYSDSAVQNEMFIKNAQRVHAEYKLKAYSRLKMYGFINQSENLQQV